MNRFFKLICCALFSVAQASPILKDSTQLIVVRTESWSSKYGKMQTYKRSALSDKWLPESQVCSVVVGKNGLGWGLGLLDLSQESGPLKKEGDGKGPAGIFDLGIIFAKKPMAGINIPFKEITKTLEAVDDPASKYYNQIVDRAQIPEVDWSSSEKMSEIDLYDVGIEVLHNMPVQDLSAGSAIFIHRWESPDIGTAGCTAMPLDTVEALALWLKKKSRPLLVQLPECEFERLQALWQLPSFIGEQSLTK